MTSRRGLSPWLHRLLRRWWVEPTLGIRGERMAERHLQQAGFTILERNHRTRYGELDLVARRGELLIFCEVKTRLRASTGTPGDAIGPDKRERLHRMAEGFLQRHPHWRESTCRFDAFLIHQEGATWTAEWLEDAFRPGW